MSTAHDLLDELRFDGAALFADSSLALDHSALTRRVRRDRTVRTSLVSVGGVAIAGALALAAGQIGQPGADVTPGSGTSAPTTSGLSDFTGTIRVRSGERIEQVAGDLAAAFGATRPQAYEALVAALPPEAAGNPEGWAAVGEYSFKDRSTLNDAAGWMVNKQLNALYSTGQSHERWHDIIVLASIVEQEAPVTADRGGVATVLQNRLNDGMPLNVTSPLAYWQQDYWKLVGQVRPDRSDYDTQGKVGLTANAIGGVSRESILAAADPRPGDALFYLLDDHGRVLLYTTYPDFVAGLEAHSS